MPLLGRVGGLARGLGTDVVELSGGDEGVMFVARPHRSRRSSNIFVPQLIEEAGECIPADHFQISS
jgi:hypothetical protein